MDLGIIFSSAAQLLLRMFNWSFVAFGNTYQVKELVIWGFLFSLVILVIRRIF